MVSIYSQYLHRDCNPFIYTAVGDTVAEDEVVCEIETDKVKLNSCNTPLLTVNMSYDLWPVHVRKELLSYDLDEKLNIEIVQKIHHFQWCTYK